MLGVGRFALSRLELEGVVSDTYRRSVHPVQTGSYCLGRSCNSAVRVRIRFPELRIHVSCHCEDGFTNIPTQTHHGISSRPRPQTATQESNRQVLVETLVRTTHMERPKPHGVVDPGSGESVGRRCKSQLSVTPGPLRRHLHRPNKQPSPRLSHRSPWTRTTKQRL